MMISFSASAVWGTYTNMRYSCSLLHYPNANEMTYLPLSLRNSECTINIYFSVFHLQGRGAWSAITLKPLIVDTNTTTHLSALQYSATWNRPSTQNILQFKNPTTRAQENLNDTGSPSTTVFAAMPPKNSQEHAEKWDKELKLSNWRQNAPDLNMFELHGGCLKNSDPWGFFLSDPMFGWVFQVKECPHGPRILH